MEGANCGIYRMRNGSPGLRVLLWWSRYNKTIDAALEMPDLERVVLGTSNAVDPQVADSRKCYIPSFVAPLSHRWTRRLVAIQWVLRFSECEY